MTPLEKILEAEFEDYVTKISELEAELAKRPVVYCARTESGMLFETYKEPQVFISIENASKWFLTIPIYGVQFERYTGQQREENDDDTA